MSQPANSDSLLKTAALGAALFLGYSLFARKKAAGTLNFIPGNIKGLYWDGMNPYLTVGVIVQNTSNYAYTLNSIAGNVFSTQNGQRYNLGNFSYFAPQKVFANSQSTVYVDLRFGLIGVVSDIINSITSGIAQTIEMSGNGNVDGIQVPINFKYNVKL
jgi:hypothetical protein